MSVTKDTERVDFFDRNTVVHLTLGKTSNAGRVMSYELLVLRCPEPVEGSVAEV